MLCCMVESTILLKYRLFAAAFLAPAVGVRRLSSAASAVNRQMALRSRAVITRNIKMNSFYSIPEIMQAHKADSHVLQGF